MVASVKNMKALQKLKVKVKGVLAFCSECEAENSACAGDYWSCLPDTVLKCCGQPMILVRKYTAYEEIGLSSSGKILRKTNKRRNNGQV